MFLKGLEKVLKGGKKVAKEGIIGVSTKQKGNEKGAKMGERGRPWGKHRAKMVQKGGNEAKGGGGGKVAKRK